MSQPKILITGGSGLLGRHLRKRFEEKNYRVNTLSRDPIPGENRFHWNIERQFIDPKALEETDTIIHLAGTSLAEGRWTAKRKKEIIDSRVKSAGLILNSLKTTSHKVKTFISASAIGFYGDCGEETADETHAPGNDFSAEVCTQWENSASAFSGLAIRVVILRIGIVLTKHGGALPKLALPVKLFAGSPLGSGAQYVSWIHIDDLSGIFLKASEDKNMKGIFNAVAPNPVTNSDLVRSLAKLLHRPVLPLRIPSFVLKTMLGEKAGIVLGGQRVNSKKIQQAGFKFRFETLESALKNIYT